MDNFFKDAVDWLVSIIGVGAVYIIYSLFFTDHLLSIFGKIWGFIEKLGICVKKANKAKIKYTIQGKLLNYSFALSKILPDYFAPNIKVKWVDENTSRKAFIENDVAVIRLRKDEPKNENIVAGTMIYISEIILRKPKRYLAPSQNKAVELFIGYKLLHDEEEILDSFVESYLYPGVNEGNEKIGDYFTRFKYIDSSNFFIPIYLQEILYLGEKVYGKKREDSIYQEVDGALDFLEMYASKKIGEKIDQPYFDGNTCKFAIMIVGRKENVQQDNHELYLDHINNHLMPFGVETIYLIGSKGNKSFIHEIAHHVKDNFEMIYSCDYQCSILDQNGEKTYVWNHIKVLRKKIRERYIE